MDRIRDRDLLDLIRDQWVKQDDQVYRANVRQNQMESMGNTLADSLTTSISELGGSQPRQDSMMKMHTVARA